MSDGRTSFAQLIPIFCKIAFSWSLYSATLLGASASRGVQDDQGSFENRFPLFV